MQTAKDRLGAPDTQHLTINDDGTVSYNGTTYKPSPQHIEILKELRRRQRTLRAPTGA
jgi:hypothetical protein